MNQTLCACGSGSAYQMCCQPHHEGTSKPDTAQKLMRSRYCAYAVGKVDYVAETNGGESKEDFDKESAEAWAKNSEWLGLEIIRSENGLNGDTSGLVEFKAKFKTQDKIHTHHEISSFEFDAKQKKWLYLEGEILPEPELRAEAKIGRNDPCPCGSGKKYKKCCA